MFLVKSHHTLFFMYSVRQIRL